MSTTAVAPVSRRPQRPDPTGPIRITYVIDNLSRAGTETQLLALIRTLDRAKFEPTLILLDGENETSRALEPANCRVIRLGVTKLLSLSALRAAKRVRAQWRQHPPAIVQAYFLDSSYFAVALARRSGVPHVLRVRNNLGYWLTRKHRLLNRLMRPWVDLSLTNSETGRESLIRQDGLSPDRVMMIENGVDLDRFGDATPTFSGTVRVGCVANLRPIKNIDGLMRAARLVVERFPNVVFEVAGEGEERSKLEALKQELNLGERFVFRGRVDDVPQFLRSIDMAVLPSHSESLSNAILEYMAAGRAIVATDVGANAKLIQHGREGVIVLPGNDQMLADGIGTLLQNPASARGMARLARARVAAGYSRDAMRTKFEELYLRLANRPR
ncbi:glycosyltransferase [Limnoglobus roseus]|uniref:glycosyltransferase n=1 Tax=Limnoglobus roseus TaxID=2598579 RepID=UPI0011EB82FA|nr:glycosyltransferase [Limnoglobus roseus]